MKLSALPEEHAPAWTGHGETVLGMPQLDACGLSETWLQKRCGELHWQGLGTSMGRPPERWMDAGGQRVYAAFGLLRLRAARLDAALEGDTLRIDSTLAPVGRSQAWSRHRLSTPAGPVGELEMLSAFVGRGEDGSNRSVRRVPMRESGPATEPDAATALAAQARAWRSRAALAAVPPDAPPPFLWQTCPRGDFNGAGLVYFPGFSAWSDRALSAWGLLGAQDRVLARDCLFLGNLDIGQTAEISLRAQRRLRGRRQLEVQLRCPVHGRLLALVETTLAG